MMTPEQAKNALIFLNRTGVQGFSEIDALNDLRAALMQLINAGSADAAKTGEKE